MSVQPTAADVDEATRPRASSASGRLLLRMPPDLHGELARAAEREGSSLNGFITARLRESVGWEVPASTFREPDPSSSTALTRILLVNALAVTLAAVVAVVILLVAWLG